MPVNVTTNYLDTVITLRKDTQANYELVGNTWIPENGEVCIVQYGDVTRFKIGDGVHYYNQLQFVDDNSGIIYNGYYMNGKFYVDSTYTEELPKSTAHLYVDKNSGTKGTMYTWDGTQFNRVTPEATDSVAGIMKLYQSSGQNTDGTMTQKCITDGVNAITFALDTTESECLVLDLPWD